MQELRNRGHHDSQIDAVITIRSKGGNKTGTGKETLKGVDGITYRQVADPTMSANEVEIIFSVSARVTSEYYLYED